jgi:hypothetical protein
MSERRVVFEGEMRWRLLTINLRNDKQGSLLPLGLSTGGSTDSGELTFAK